MVKNISVIRGDGIGPEIVNEAIKVLDKVAELYGHIFNYFVSDVTDLADTIREAFKLAKSGRPGPVLIDVPKDVQIAMLALLVSVMSVTAFAASGDVLSSRSILITAHHLT